MIAIRTATELDIPKLIELGRRMHKESRYHGYRFNANKLGQTLERVVPLNLSFVAETKAGEIVGAFVGGASEMFFGNDVTSFDLFTYVVPGHRGRAGLSLLKAYIHRAKVLRGRGKVQEIRIGVSAGIDSGRIGKLYERLGFRHIGGGAYVLED